MIYGKTKFGTQGALTKCAREHLHSSSTHFVLSSPPRRVKFQPSLGGSKRMRKTLLLLAVLALALPISAFAGSSIDFTNSGGMLTGSNSGLSLGGSTLIAVNGLNG